MKIPFLAHVPRMTRRALLALLCTVALPACQPSPDAGGDGTDSAEPAGRLHFRMVTRFGFGGSMYHDEEFFFLMPGGRMFSREGA